jgi:hypothetical protein
VDLVVDTGVKAELVHGVGALVRAAGNADHAAAARLGQRRKGTAHGAGGGADDHGFTGLGRDDLDQPVPGRDAGHADRAQVVAQRHVGGVHLAQRAGLVGVDHAVLLPAAHADDLVAGLEARVLRLDHLADDAALHHLAQRLRLGVALAGVHAPAHVGVQAQEVVLHQHLAVL